MRSLDLIECEFTGKIRSIKFSRNTHVTVVNCRLRDSKLPIELRFDAGICELLRTTHADLTKGVFRVDLVNIGTLRISSGVDEFAAPEISKLVSQVQHLVIANYKIGIVRLPELSFVKQSIVFERCGVGTDTVFAYGELGSEFTSPQLRFEKCIVVGSPRAQ